MSGQYYCHHCGYTGSIGPLHLAASVDGRPRVYCLTRATPRIPTGWLYIHVTPGGPHGAAECDPVFSYGEDKPDDEHRWFPLYR